jgi:hypothetical protein
MFPSKPALYLGAADVGIAASPLWVSQGILITHLAMVYAKKRGETDATAHVGFFNGIFGTAMLLQGVAGSLVMSAFEFLTTSECDDVADDVAGGNTTAAAAAQAAGDGGEGAISQGTITGEFGAV